MYYADSVLPKNITIPLEGKMIFRTEPLNLDVKMVIYKISNLKNNKCYIGQTMNEIKKRYKGELGKGMNPLLKRAIKKYGIDNFYLSILEQCSDLNSLNKAEAYWIAYYDSTNPKKGYNLRSGGENSSPSVQLRKELSKKCSGWHHTEEAKRKISASSKLRTGRKHTIEAREKMRLAHLGHAIKEETKEKIRKANLGRVITWGNKITEAKTKVKRESIVEYLRVKPYALGDDIMKHFGFKTKGFIRRHGGLRSLRREANIKPKIKNGKRILC